MPIPGNIALRSPACVIASDSEATRARGTARRAPIPRRCGGRLDCCAFAPNDGLRTLGQRQ